MVSTWMSKALSDCVWTSCVRTLVLMVVSSTYWPVVSRPWTAAQAASEALNASANATAVRRGRRVMKLSVANQLSARLDPSTDASRKRCEPHRCIEAGRLRPYHFYDAG